MAEKTHYTARELAGLPGLPGTERGVQKKAKRESWHYREVSASGGPKGMRTEYPLATLPEATRAHLAQQLMASISERVAQVPAPTAGTALAPADAAPRREIATLKRWQTQTMDARIYFIRLIERAVASGIGVTRAIGILVEQAKAGTLPPEAQGVVALANQRSGTDTKKRALSERSLMRWWSEWNKNGCQPTALAPRDVERTEVPPWAPHFLQVYRVPQKISVTQALEDLADALPTGMPMPSEHQVRRFVARYSKIDIQRGRVTGKEFKALKGFVRRDTSMNEPLDICLCDGHSFKAKVAHPVHGRPFNPEVCAVIDAVTRVCTGWSAGLAESSQTVADAYRHAVTINDEKRYGGIPAILYADKGSGNEAKVNADPFIGMYARLGSTYRTGIPGNSQARGRIERMQASLWIRAAKKLLTYTGKGMDEATQRKVYLTMERDVKQALKDGVQGKKSSLLLSWQEFLEFLAAEVEAYNRRPHSALPRITCPTTGLRRNMSPLEMWAKWLTAGWEPMRPEQEELDSLFRPHVMATTRRGEVRLFGNFYYAPELVHYNGTGVIVAYDVHDANQVWVKDGDERLICVARWNANKRGFYPVSAAEKAVEDRRQRRTKTLELRLDEVQAEGNPAIDVLPTVIELPQEVEEFKVRQLERATALEESRQYFTDPGEVYADIRRREQSGQATAYESSWANDRQHSLENGKRIGLYRDDPECAGRFPAAGNEKSRR